MKLPKIVVCLLTLQLAVGQIWLSAQAQEVPPPEPTVNDLDLGSTERTVSASTVLQSATQATITAGTGSVTFTSTDMLTAAEMVAVRQVLATGRQFLQLNEQGVATGGGLHLQYYASNGLGNLVIPEGVRASQNAAVLQSLNLTGNLTNSGTFNLFSTNAAITSATVNAANIYNTATGTISTNLANLNLNAINNIVNAGNIMSSGNLNLTAGGSISNMSGMLAIMQAANNLSLQAANITNQGQMVAQFGNVSALTAQVTNSGIMQSLAGNINIHNLIGTQLSVDGILGSISAAHNIDFSTLATVKDASNNVIEKSQLNLSGNSLSAQAVNFLSPDGIVNVNTDRIDGGVAVIAGIAQIGTFNGNLTITGMELSGDPIYYAAGDLELGGLFSPATFNTSGGDFVALAGGNINATGAPGNALVNAATSASSSTPGGRITIAAGVDFTISGGASPITCPGGNCSGLFSITGVSTSGGNVNMPTVSLTTRANQVNIEAHSGLSNSGTISILDIKTSGGEGGATGSTSSEMNGGRITIEASSNVTTGNINAYGNGAVWFGGGGGEGGAGGPVSIMSVLGNININGIINAFGGGGAGNGGGGGDGGAGGTVNIFADAGSITVTSGINTSGGGGGANGGGGGSGGAAGNITILASSTVSIDGPVLAAGGGSKGGAGLDPNGGGGSFGGGGGGGTDIDQTVVAGGTGGGEFGVGGAAASGGGGWFGGGSAGNWSSGGGMGGSGTGGQGGVVGGNGTSGKGGSATATGGSAGTNAGTQGGGTITITGSSVSITKTIGTEFGFTLSPFAAYSVYAGTSGRIYISTPNAYFRDGDFETGTRIYHAPMGSSSFTVGGSGSIGSMNAGSGIFINRTSAGTNVTSGTFAANTSSISITENGSSTPISNGTLVTPAEWLAVVQTYGGGQTVTLNTSGNATAGTISLSSQFSPGGNFYNMTIPAGVSATVSGSGSQPVFAVETSLINKGTMTISGGFMYITIPSITINPSALLTGSAFYLFTNNLTNNGTISATTNNTQLYIQGSDGALFTSVSNGNLSVSGTGNIQIAGTTGTMILTAVNTGSSLNLSGTQTLSAGNSGTVNLQNFYTSGNITFAANANYTVATGTTVSINSQNINFGADSSFSASQAATINLTASSGSMIITTADNDSATITTTGGAINITPSIGGQSITFAKSGAIGPAYLNLYGGPTTITTTGAGSTTINSGVNLVTNSSITVNGTLNNNGSISNSTILISLDLTDSSVTSFIQTQQGLSNLGGTLIVSGGIAQPGSTLTIQPANLSASLSSFNIPAGVIVTMDSFTGSNTITIDITGSSYTDQAILSGTAAFGSGSGTLVVNSTFTGTAFLVNSTGTLSSSATLDISTNQSVTIAGTITASTLNIQTTVNNGPINIMGSITGSAGVNLTTHGSGSVSTDASSFILSTNSPITITASDVSFLGSVNAGAGTVTLRPNGSQAMSLNGAGGIFTVLSADLNAITAQTLVLGSNTSSGGITLVAGLTLPSSGTPGTTAGLYNLDLRSGAAGGTYSAGINGLNIRGQNLTINVAGSANTGSGAISGTSGTVSITGGGVTTGSVISLSGNGTINLTATGSTNISLANSLTTASGGQINLSTGTGNVANPTTGTITTGSLTLLSTSGNFGNSTSSRLPINVTNLTANTAGNVYATNTGALTIGPGSATNSAALFNVYSGNTLTVAGNITASNYVDIGTNGNNAQVNINANVTGTTTVILVAHGTGNVVSGASNNILSTAGSIQITANDVTFGGTVTATGQAVVMNTNNSHLIEVGGTSVSGAFHLTNTTLSALTGGTTLVVQGGNGITVTGSLDISSTPFNSLQLRTSGPYTGTGQTITIGGKEFYVLLLANGDVFTGTITGTAGSYIEFQSGNVTTINVNGPLTAEDVSLMSFGGGNINLSSNITTTVRTTLNTVGAIEQSTGLLTAGQLYLFGDLGVGMVTPIQSATALIRIGIANAAGSGFVSNAGAVLLDSANAGNQLQIVTTGTNAHITTSTVAIFATNGQLQLVANGNITTSADLTGNSLSLQTSSGSNGSITLNRNATGTTGVTITADGTGNVTNAVTRSISSTNAPIVITANDVTFSGTVNAGTSGSVSLVPNGAKSISVGGAGGTFSVVTSDLSAITAGTLTVGTTAQAGGFTVAGNLDVSGVGPAGAYNLVFNNGGNYTAAGRTITLGTKTLTVNTLGTLDTGTVTGGNTTVALSGGTGLTASGAVTVTGGTLTLATTNNGTITISANIGGGATTTIDAHGTGDITRTGLFTVTGTTINLSSDTGDIGDLGTQILTAASTLTVNTGTPGTAFVNNTGPLTVGTSTVGGDFRITTNGTNADITTSGNITSSTGDLRLSANGNLNINNPLSANSMMLVAIAASNGSINLNANVTSNNDLILTIGGGTGNVISAGSTSLTSNNGDITITANDVSLAGIVSSPGTVALFPNGAKSISVAGAGGTFSVLSSDLVNITAGTLIVGTTAQSGGFTVAGNIDVSGSGAGTYNLSFNNGGNYTAAGQTITLGTKTLSFNALGTLDTGTVTGGNTTISLTGGTGLTASGNVTVTSGTVTLATTANGAITVAGNVGGGTTTNVNANGTGTITRSGNFTLSGTTLNLTSGSGDIGQSGTPILINSSNPTASTTGSIYIQNVGNLNLSDFSAGATSTLNLSTSNNGSIDIDSNVSVAILVLNAGGSGTITRSGNFTLTATTVNLSSGSGDIGASGTEIQTAAGTLTLSTTGSAFINEANSVNLGASSVSGTLDLDTAANGGITITGNSNAATMNLTANGSGSITRSGNFSLTATDLTFTSGSGDLGSFATPLQVTAGTLNYSTTGGVYIVQNGNLNLGAFTTAGDIRLGTAAGSNGSITITGDLSGNTVNLTADGTGTITRTGNFTVSASTLNLTAGTGDIGSLVTPLLTNTGTITVNTSGGSAFISELSSVTLGTSTMTGTLQLSTASGSNGAISIGGNVSATNLNLDADGTGTISRTGNLTLTATTINLSSDAGNLGVLGTELQTNADTLSLNTSGSAFVNESNSVTFTTSTVGGTLNLGTASDGAIAISGNLSATTMDLSANGSGTITRTGNFTLTANDLILASGSGDIGTAGTPILTDANSHTYSTGGHVFVSETDAMTLNASNVGGTLTLNAGGAITTGGDTSADSLDVTTPQLINANNLIATGPAGTINVQSASGQGLIVGGNGTMTAGGGNTLTATDQTLLFSGDQTFTGDTIFNALGTTGNVAADPGVAVFSSGNMTINTFNPAVNQAAFGSGGTVVVNTTNPPPPPPAPPAAEVSTPTIIALLADASGASGIQGLQRGNDPIIISTDQNQGVAGSSLSQSLLTGITNGLSTILFGGGGSAPSSTISNSNSLTNAPGAGFPPSGTTSTGPIVTSDVDLTPFADLLPSGSLSVSGNVLESKSGKSPSGESPQALTAQAGRIVPAPSDNKNGQGNTQSSMGEVFKASGSRTDLVMFTMANQVFSGFIGGNTDSTVSGTPGTIFSTDKNTVVLHTGRMLTDNGKQPMTVFTNQAAVMIGADSAAVVDVHPGAPTRVMAVAGQGNAPTTVRTRDGLVIPLKAGQEVIIGQTDLSNEDLIPVDGMDREFVSGGIQLSSRKVAKDNFSLDEFMDKEIMVAGVPVRLGGSNNKRLQGKISAAAKNQSRNSNIAANYHKKKKQSDEDDTKGPSVITKSPAKEQTVTQATNEPARVLAEKDSQFSLTQPGHMKLIKGSLFMRSNEPTVVDTPLGQVHGAKGSMFKVTSDEGKARVQALSGPDHVSVVAGKRLIPLNCGKEVFISDHKPSQSESVPADGVGRRGMSAYALDGALSAIVGDFSMVTLLNSAPYLNSLKHPVSGSDQKSHAQIVKAAAVIQQVLGNRGRYYIAPKQHAAAPLPDWVFKATSSKPDLPLLKALLDKPDNTIVRTPN